MLELFNQIPVSLPKPVGYINKRQILLTDTCGKLFMYNHKSKIPPMKSPILRKEEKKKGSEDLDSDSSFLPGVPEYHEFLGAGARDE